MRFDRVKKDLQTFGVTNRRLVHARKAVQRDKDSWALFPEFVKHETPEERIEAIDAGKVEWERVERLAHAAKWKEARARLRKFPEPLRSRLRAYWDSRTMLPGSPIYLAGLLYDAEVGRFDPVTKQREIDRCRVLGQVTSEVAASIVIPILPGEPQREIYWVRSHVAREIAQARAPFLFPPLVPDEASDVFAACYA